MFKVVDLFAGPGGLAEGFSALHGQDGEVIFRVALSIEKDPAAFATLRLRAFYRQFQGSPPLAYYDHLAGDISHENLVATYPDEWQAACRETLCLELGAAGSEDLVNERLDEIRTDGGDGLILIGGPPCQAYSLAGRSRNAGNASYVASEDHRHFLYREYIRILNRLRPAAFVMENVKGLLSAKVDNEPIFERVLEDLRASAAPDGYTIVPLSPRDRKDGHNHVLHSELHGIPQCRHRVILFGIRNDLADGSRRAALLDHAMEARHPLTTVRDVLEGMPVLRSGLSRVEDSAPVWRSTASAAFQLAAEAVFAEECDLLDRVAERLVEHARDLRVASGSPPRRADTPSMARHALLAAWFSDSRLLHVPNHESRAHMAADLARYAFASTFAELEGVTPKASDFPKALAPDHRSWTTGSFADRFRVQVWDAPSTTVTSHISKDGHYFIHPDPLQCRSLTVREAARLQTFPDNYLFKGNRTEQYVQVGNAVPPLLALQIAEAVAATLMRIRSHPQPRMEFESQAA